MNGTVKKLVSDKNFGFIRGTDGKEYFFHKQDFNGFWDDLAIDISNNQTIPVTFDSVPSDKGPRASAVNRVDSGVGGNY